VEDAIRAAHKPLPADTGLIKGACLIQALTYLEKLQGRSRIEEAMNRMPPDLYDHVDATRASFGLISSEWYSTAATHFILDCITRPLGTIERETLARALAKAVMDSTLRGVYGFLFSIMATPDRYARHAPQLWANYYADGRVALVTENKTMTAAIRDWKGHHPFLCAVVQYARVAALESMGCKEVSSEMACKSHIGGGECSARHTWL